MNTTSISESLKKHWALWTTLIVTLVYAPFMGYRVVRTAGDEKVYVSQALEMAAHGNWFVQRLQNQPDYYKGPLHYIFLRIGLILFGKSAWAALYMNYLLLIVGALCIGALVRKYCAKWKTGDVWAAAFFATCVGVYTHSFASQMESELACLFALALFLLDRTGKERPGFFFWTIAGLIGWSKSPLHSALAGSAAVLFWLASGQLLYRMKRWKSWAAVFWGIAFCTAGYLPAFILDHDNFVNYYITRETLSKGDSGQSWTVSFVSVLGFYLLPWLLLALVAYAEGLWNLVSGKLKDYSPETRRALLLAVCWVTPSFLFFAWHPYHFENYNLPVISGVILLISVIIGHRSARFDPAYRLAAYLTALIILALPALVIAVDSRFSPLPVWWPEWLAPLSCILTVGASAVMIGSIWKNGLQRAGILALAMVGFFLSLGATLTAIGERELFDLRTYLTQQDAAGDHIKIVGYYNLQQNIWSEWGFLNLWTDRTYHEIHKETELKEDLLNGEPVIVPAHGSLDDFRAFVAKDLPGVSLDMIPWKRWRTQGKSDTGQPLWLDAWNKRDLSELEIDYYIARIKR